MWDGAEPGSSCATTDSTFSNNGQTSRYGGAVYSIHSQLDFDSATFELNSVRCDDDGQDDGQDGVAGGGAMWIDGRSVLTMRSSYFRGNVAPDAGALMLRGAALANILTTIFEANHAATAPPTSLGPWGIYNGSVEVVFKGVKVKLVSSMVITSDEILYFKLTPVGLAKEKRDEANPAEALTTVQHPLGPIDCPGEMYSYTAQRSAMAKSSSHSRQNITLRIASTRACTLQRLV
jgi:hypothetical protein